jgi:hypothetical protein
MITLENLVAVVEAEFRQASRVRQSSVQAAAVAVHTLVTVVVAVVETAVVAVETLELAAQIPEVVVEVVVITSTTDTSHYTVVMVVQVW